MSKKTREARAAKRARQEEEFRNAKRSLVCPQCSKQRMLRPLGHEVSLEKKAYTARNDEEIELFIDICDSCVARNFRIHFEPTKADAKKVLQAMKESQDLGEDVSLEEML